ncbi:UNVERIFIED_CONTAM: 50S ribosomal protein L18, chloroplastic [Sesamum radiatum]|uniref:Large ribosomal subunit protein uL18c n=1 Tax=Sesamum radiatum TaxID=300843 RepID=A0AAW2KNY8_SESRA
MSCNSISLSFLQSTWATTRTQQLRDGTRPSSVPALALHPRRLVVEAKSRTRTQDRTARHARILTPETSKVKFDFLPFQIEGTPERPRLCVFRSNKHIYAQVIDDSKMHTLASASTMQKPISEEFDYSSGPTIDVAKKVGEILAKTCLEKGITKVAFDRGGYPYHGRIEALADAAREHGLQF